VKKETTRVMTEILLIAFALSLFSRPIETAVAWKAETHRMIAEEIVKNCPKFKDWSEADKAKVVEWSETTDYNDPVYVVGWAPYFHHMSYLPCHAAQWAHIYRDGGRWEYRAVPMPVPPYVRHSCSFATISKAEAIGRIIHYYIRRSLCSACSTVSVGKSVS
jgi:hypothetical protein